ncbi:amidohydrolase family protein [Candidatus Rariloculus sp.]|uniref:amidohydrolase family protein n=1 Tax=Candidatus Rariloculus sp. TaxID=3101265 RepID=UPI003D138780
MPLSGIPVCMAPDPDTKTPDYQPPPGACDAHCHIFGPGAVYPYAPGRSYTPPDAPLSRFKALQSTLGLTRAVLVNASCHGTDNTVILDAIAESGGSYRGVANVGQSVSDDEFARLNDGGIRGIRFNFVRHLGGTPDMDVFHDLVERIAPLGWHVVLHFDAVDLLEFGDMLRSLPVPFIIDHMGRVPTSDGLDQKPFEILLETARMDNCWIKICGAERISSAGPPFTDAVPFARAALETAPDRTLWGTDWPHPNIAKHMPNDGDLVDLIPLYTSDAVLQRKVLVDNPHRLYGFTDQPE